MILYYQSVVEGRIDFNFSLSGTGLAVLLSFPGAYVLLS
jgi:hypothetical protein